jgi:hypothetical protein
MNPRSTSANWRTYWRYQLGRASELALADPFSVPAILPTNCPRVPVAVPIFTSVEQRIRVCRVKVQ